MGVDTQDHLKVDEAFKRIIRDSENVTAQGSAWEMASKFYLENSPFWSSRFEHVWLWNDAPEEIRQGHGDVGIDLVAREKGGACWAIQCKCYTSGTLSERDVATFFMQAAGESFAGRILIDTAPSLSRNLEEYIETHDDVVRICLDDMRQALLPWEQFWTHGMHLGHSEAEKARKRMVHEPRPHQREAIDAAKKALDDADRTTLVMACGTGKTLTVLRLAEEVAPGGTILYLAPSISLVAQSMRDWANQVRDRLNPYVVCSDPKASSLGEGNQRKLAESYGSLSMVPYEATTNASLLAARFKTDPDALNVVFSTYQSIDKIRAAQQAGIPNFDLIICDEAHRTTGKLKGETGDADDASFVRIHSNNYVCGTKRLYMTATPRIYRTDDSQASLTGDRHRDEGLIATMDDESIYGSVCYRLSFGKAVSLGLLTDYKIVVMEVSEEMLPNSVQQLLADANNELKMPDVAKFIGVWKALFDRRHAKGAGDLIGESNHTASEREVLDDARRPLHHAIAFASSIAASKSLMRDFQGVIDSYRIGMNWAGHPVDTAFDGAKQGAFLDVKVDHVDGTMDSQTRKSRLDWLAERTDDNVCHVLSNARCLAEGIDVPDLDAVIYLSARKSKVDIIQSVGRVMRKAPGKEYGYIILPIFVAAGTDPREALVHSDMFKVVYQVVSALRSHDERLEAKLAAADIGDTEALRRIIEVEVLDSSKLGRPKKRAKPRTDDEEPATENDPDEIMQSRFELPDEELAEAIYAQIVRKCGTKIYWGEWAGNVGAVTQARASQIKSLVAEDGPAREAFLTFLSGLRDTLNPDYDENEAVNVLAQHEVTSPIFRALFNDNRVLENNPIVLGLDRALESLHAAGLSNSIDAPDLQDLYNAVRMSAEQVTSETAKQELIRTLYNDFFSKAFADTADMLGIVYTPIEVVDAQLHLVQRVLEREFGTSMSDAGVHILDGFAGTGTYLSRLIEDRTLITDEQLPSKYMHDLHSNEIVPLAATIMDINIEQSYHARAGGEYVAFPGALLADTFQMSEDTAAFDNELFRENAAHVLEQENIDITVLLGNPPYRAADTEKTGHQNAKYTLLDGRIRDTYAAKTQSTNKNSLYDSYIRAFRWASDRIGDSGVICFVSNNGWLTGDSGAGVRRSFVEEFNSIYVYNLRGNQRTQGDLSRREGGKIFGSGSRAGIAITMLVKNPNSDEHGVIRYRDIGERLSREQKLDILRSCVDADPDWEILEPDRHGDWTDKRNESWYRLAPVGLSKDKGPLGIFRTWSQGIKTNRDTWVWNYSKSTLEAGMHSMVDRYNEAVDDHELGKGQLDYGDTRIKWGGSLETSYEKGIRLNFDANRITLGQYRPFCKQWLYYDPAVIERSYRQPRLFPPSVAADTTSGENPPPDSLFSMEGEGLDVIDSGHRVNLEICMTGKSTHKPFSAWMVTVIPDLEVEGKSQCLPLYVYTRNANGGYTRNHAITDEALGVFQAAYEDASITKEDIFFYVYGILNCPEYTQQYATNLDKELPRIPLAKDFRAFESAGRKLADLHTNYEKVDRWPVEEVGNSQNPGRTEKMRWIRRRDPDTRQLVDDPTALRVAEDLVIRSIPERAHDYIVNGRSALAWLMDRYQVRSKSGIVNDPNLFEPDNPRHIVDLVESVITVSMRTLEIMDAMPAIEEVPHPDNWPETWNNLNQ